MAYKVGLVQRIFMDPAAGSSETIGCIFIGPTPTNVEILLLSRRATDPAHTGAFISSMLDALAQALTSRREVSVYHDDSDAYIVSVELR
jgi:hypothetical protein